MRLLLLLCLLIMGCRRAVPPPQPPPPPPPPPEPHVIKVVVKLPEEVEYGWAEDFRASEGLAQYEDSIYSHLQTVDGPLEIYNSLVTKYIMTDQQLAVDCSDVGGVNVAGKAWIHQSVVRNDSIFLDTLRSYESRFFGKLTIGGDFTACDSHFSEDVVVDGDVTAEGSTFEGFLTATAEIVDLHHSKVKAIIIEPTGPYYDPQVVQLREGSIVTGDILFKSGRGKVCIDKTSQFYGRVHGGHVLSHHYWEDH